VRQRIPAGLRLLCDPFLMRQALANLLDNALDFTPQQGALAFELERDGERVALSLFNQGQAIPEYALDRVSERFYSLPRPGTGRKSTGLGLNFVAEVMQLHGAARQLSYRGPLCGPFAGEPAPTGICAWHARG